MKTIKNKELTLELTHYLQNDKGIAVVTKKEKVSVYDLLIEIIKKPKPQLGIGDLEEQHLRLKLLGQVKSAKEEDKESIKIEDAEGKFLSENILNMEYTILDQGLLDFQEMVKKLGEPSKKP